MSICLYKCLFKFLFKFAKIEDTSTETESNDGAPFLRSKLAKVKKNENFRARYETLICSSGPLMGRRNRVNVVLHFLCLMLSIYDITSLQNAY